MRLTIRNSDGSVSQPINTTIESVFEKLAGYEDAEGQGRLIKLPCKIGDTVWVIPTKSNGLTQIIAMKCIGFSISKEVANANLKDKKNKLYQPCFCAFGKTVFRTEEEAEAALRA